MALSVTNPQLPSGGPVNMAKTAAKDTLSAGYVLAVFGLAAAGVAAVFAVARSRGLIPQKAADVAAGAKSWFGGA